MSVAIIILQYGNHQATIDCIDSVEKFNSYPIKYIVVDNGSPNHDDSEAIARYLNKKFHGQFLQLSDNQAIPATLPCATLLQSATNDGYARGNNKGLTIAYTDEQIDKILILNNDIIFVDDIIPRLVADVDSLEECALVSPLLYKKNLRDIDPNCARFEGRLRDTIIYNFRFLKTTHRIERATFIPVKPMSGIIPVQLVSGSCIMCDKTTFRHIGSFDPGTFLYCEENILWEKIKRENLKNYVDTDIRAIHLGASTIGKLLSPKLLKMALESQYYFYKNYHTGSRWKLFLLRLSQWWVVSAFTIKLRLKRH